METKNRDFPFLVTVTPSEQTIIDTLLGRYQANDAIEILINHGIVIRYGVYSKLRLLTRGQTDYLISALFNCPAKYSAIANDLANRIHAAATSAE